jgi:hypothetical protein
MEYTVACGVERVRLGSIGDLRRLADFNHLAEAIGATIDAGHMTPELRADLATVIGYMPSSAESERAIQLLESAV